MAVFSLKRCLIALMILFLLGAAVLFWQWQSMQRFMQTSMQLPAEGVTIQLNKGDTLRTVWSRLEKQQVLERSDYPQFYARWYRRGQAIKAGEYAIPFGTTPLQLLQRLEQGDVTRYTITLVEGWTFAQVMQALKSNPALKQELTADQIADSAQLFQSLKIDKPLAMHPEGLFFPDTYQFLRGDSDLSILRRAYLRLQKILDEEWANRQPNLPLKTPYEALILASLIERETGVAAERAKIAGVFVRRLQKSMLLQTDPTIIYGLGQRYDGNLRSADLKDDKNPYNTYRRPGLTPTPIALAGREAIRAALQPEAGDELYFVARGDGSHQFTATLDEHNKAVRKYQLARKSDYRSSPALPKQ